MLKFDLDPIGKKVSITGFTPSVIGAANSNDLDALALRVAAIESKLAQSAYDLKINGGNGAINVVSINIDNSQGTNIEYSLPNLFKSLALEGGKEGLWTDFTNGTTSLQQRWEEGTEPGTARGLIQAGNIKNIVLQELGDIPLTNPDLFFQYMQLFVAEIRQYNPLAAIYVIENWIYLDSTNWQTDCSALHNIYKNIVAELDIRLIPCLIGWNIIRQLYGFTALNPYLDNQKPNLIGTYLNALIAAAKITGLNPLNNTFVPFGLSFLDAVKIQDAAYKALIASDTNPFIFFTFNTAYLRAGQLIGSSTYRASCIQIYGKNVNWTSGEVRSISPNGVGAWYQGLAYPNINDLGLLLYQDPANPIAVTGTESSPQTITGLDPNKRIYCAVNDFDYSDNLAAFTVAYR